MERLVKKGFLGLQDAEIPDYPLTADASLQIPAVYLAGVIDNLRSLHRHALLVVAATPTDVSSASKTVHGTFEP